MVSAAAVVIIHIFRLVMVSAAHVVVTYFQILIELVAHEFMIYVQSSMISVVNVIMRDFQTLMSINYYKIKVLAAELVYLVIQYFAIKFVFQYLQLFSAILFGILHDQ